MQQLDMSRKQTIPQKLLPKSSLWFNSPDSLSLVCDSDYGRNLWLNGGKKLQGMTITGLNNGSHTAYASTPNWRRPYYNQSSRRFDDWKELQSTESQRVA